MKLTRADKAAIQNGDSTYLVNKGIRFFYDQEYEVAVEYFHLASAMGNGKAAGNLGYCYMYGKGVPTEVDLALSYFRIAMESRDIDSFYKLGKIYCSGEGIEKDRELGLYYYESALAELIENYSVQERLCYPELYYELALEKLAEETANVSYATAYKYLLIAQTGFSLAVSRGAYYYEKNLEEVEEKMKNSSFDEVKKDVKKEFEEEFLIG